MNEQIEKLNTLIDELQKTMRFAAEIAEIRKNILRTHLEAAIANIELERANTAKRAENGDETAQRHDFKLCGKRESLEDLRTVLVMQGLI